MKLLRSYVLFLVLLVCLIALEVEAGEDKKNPLVKSVQKLIAIIGASLNKIVSIFKKKKHEFDEKVGSVIDAYDEAVEAIGAVKDIDVEGIKEAAEEAEAAAAAAAAAVDGEEGEREL